MIENPRPTIVKAKRKVIYTGSVKTSYDAGPGVMAVVHNDTWSAFDRGRSPQLLPGMGTSVFRATMASIKLANAIGIPNHFIEQEDENTILVRRFRTPKGRPLWPDEVDVMIRGEFIRRELVMGRRAREYVKGDRKPTLDGFTTDEPPPEGTPFPCPTHEMTTKWASEDLEVYGLQKILEYLGITEDEWHRIWTLVDTLDGAVDLAVSLAGFRHPDSKKEFALVRWGRKPRNVRHRQLMRMVMLIDAWATQNEDRFILKSALAEGKIEHYSKEWLRQHLIALGFKKTLDEARARGAKTLPNYPVLSEEDVHQVTERYRIFADRYEKAVETVISGRSMGLR